MKHTYYVLARSLWQGDTWKAISYPVSKQEAVAIAAANENNGLTEYGNIDHTRVIHTVVVSKTRMQRVYKVSEEQAAEQYSEYLWEQNWRAEMREVEPAQPEFVNIDERYGDRVATTIEDYRELNPAGNFTQDSDGIYEDGQLIAELRS